MNNLGKGVWAESRDLSPCIHVTARILMELTGYDADTATIRTMHPPVQVLSPQLGYD